MFKTAFQTFRHADPQLTTAQARDAFGGPDPEDWVMSNDGKNWTDAGENRDEAVTHAEVARNRYVAKAERGTAPDATVSLDSFEPSAALMDALHEHIAQFFCEQQECYSVEEGTLIDLAA